MSRATSKLPWLSIKALYALALAEGEGVGTAYEYFAKRLVLRPWLPQFAPVRRLLVAGLPEKYGASLDHLLLAQELGATAVVVDDRPQALAKMAQALAAAQAVGWLTAVAVETVLVADLAQMAELQGPFDLAIANEVLQRLPASERLPYLQRQRQLATAVATFCPNAANPDHAKHSGLGTVALDELRVLAGERPLDRFGYIDMPPFPTGVVRSEAQRNQAESGWLEGVAMWGLGYFARLEHGLPTAVRRQKSHIIYTLTH